MSEGHTFGGGGREKEGGGDGLGGGGDGLGGGGDGLGGGGNGLGEAAMVQLAPEVAAKVLPEAEETVVSVKVAAVMVKPEPEVVRMEVVGMALPKAVEMVVVVEALEEAAGMEAAARVKPEFGGGGIQGGGGGGGGGDTGGGDGGEEGGGGEALRNRPEIRRVVPGVEIMVVVHMVEDSAAAASVKKETEEAKPQKQLLRELQVRAVVEVVDSRVAMADHFERYLR